MRCPEYTYKTEVQASHGMNKHSGFGGLCADPYGDEFQFTVKRHLEDSDKDKSLAFNFTDPCQELTMNLLQTMRGFDHAVQEEELLRPFIWADRASCSWFWVREHSL